MILGGFEEKFTRTSFFDFTVVKQLWPILTEDVLISIAQFTYNAGSPVTKLCKCLDGYMDKIKVQGD